MMYNCFMERKKLFKLSFWLLVIIGIMDYIGVKFYLFWPSGYYDIPMHFLGGLWISLVFLWIWSKFKNLILFKEIFNKIIIIVMIVGILWEIFEIIVGATSLSDGIFYWKDTFGDLTMDFIGGFIGSFAGFRIINSKKN